jgi:NADPH:quinone reductase
MFACTASRAELELRAGRLFEMVERGVVKINVNQRFEQSDVADAHRALEGRGTTGATILIP